MCRSIKRLRDGSEIAGDTQIRDAALQYVRKVSDFNRPSQRHADAFERAVDEVAEASRRLLESVGSELRALACSMAEWIYFIHPPRDNFAQTMSDEERAVWGKHFERLQRLHSEGSIILVGPTLGRINTGICVFEAPDEEAARRVMEEDPTIAGGYATGELRPFRLSLLRGRA